MCVLVIVNQCTEIVILEFPKGSILGPILISLYINDLPLVCSSVSIQMYADDTVLYVHAKNKKQAANILAEALVHV